MRNLKEIFKSSYVIIVMTILGITAFVTAVMISWPALANLAAKFFG